MSNIKFISIDPSLANTGVVYGIIENGVLKPEGWVLTQTSKSKEKSIRVSSDTIDRVRRIFSDINTLINEINPQVIFAETPSGSQSANSMKGYGISCSIIASLAPAPIEITPIEVKVQSVGKKTASKKQMIDWAVSNFPDFPFEYKSSGEIHLGKMEHIADAIAIANAGIKSKQYSQIIRV